MSIEQDNRDAWDALWYDIMYGWDELEREAERMIRLAKKDKEIKKNLKSRCSELDEIGVKILRSKQFMKKQKKKMA